MRGTTTDEKVAAPQEKLPFEIWVLVAASFVIAVGFGIVAPALPTFATSFDVGVTAASAVISVFAFMRLAFAPVSGKLVTAFGERSIYTWGLLIVAVSTGMCAFAQTYWQLMVFRGVGGIGSTMFTVSAVALLVRLSPPSMRGRAAGLWATSFLLGNIVGPLVGGGLVIWSIRAPFLVYAGALIVAAVAAWLFLRRSPLAGRDPQRLAQAVTVRQALRHRTYVAALAASFANGWGVFGVRISLIPLFVVEALQRDESLAGIALAVFAAGNAVVLLIAGRLADTIGRKPLVIAGLLVSGGGTVWLGYTDSLVTFFASSLVAGVGAGLLSPPMNAAVADIVGSKGRGGTVLAASQMAADVGAIIGPIAAGAIAQTTSYSMAFAVTGGISLLAVLFWLRAPETLPKPGTDAAGGSAATTTEPGTPPGPDDTAGAVAASAVPEASVPDPARPDAAAAAVADGRGEVSSAVRAAECGCLDEGPEVPLGERVSGRPRHPDA